MRVCKKIIIGDGGLSVAEERRDTWTLVGVARFVVYQTPKVVVTSVLAAIMLTMANE
jgi:hypothetical protein